MYTEQSFQGDLILTGTAEDLTASPAVYDEWVAGLGGYTIHRLGFVVTTTVACDTAAPVVEFNRRVTAGSASGEVQIDTLTIPDGTAAGSVVYAELSSPVTINPGEGLAAEHITQGTDSGTAAGAGYYVFLGHYDPVNPAANSDMIESA